MSAAAGLGAHVQVLAYQAVSFYAQNHAPGTPGSDDTPKGPEFGKASPVGIPIVLILLIATVALVWNMNTHIKRLPESFDTENPGPDQLADEGTDRAGVEPEAEAGADAEAAGGGPSPAEET